MPLRALSGFEKPLLFNRAAASADDDGFAATRYEIQPEGHCAMDVDKDLLGKTITGVIASAHDESPREIWLLQFSDGTHVEFVSPAARKALHRCVERRKAPLRRHSATGQLTLNVA
jgi:hypothetical protein